MTETTEKTKEVVTNDGIDLPWSIEELKALLGVGFYRTPCDEHMVFRVLSYNGLRRILNGKYGYEYRGHVYHVEYYRAASVNYSKPLPGILEIEEKRWKKGCKGLHPADLVGVCEISADSIRIITLLKVDGKPFGES
jgi:hypothetical protein